MSIWNLHSWEYVGYWASSGGYALVTINRGIPRRSTLAERRSYGHYTLRRVSRRQREGMTAPQLSRKDAREARIYGVFVEPIARHILMWN